eukprot:6207231-Pleurochrysis_carterae.AAC.1
MRSGSPVRSGEWARCKPRSPSAGRRAALPPAPPLDRLHEEIRSGDGGWVKEITRTCARRPRHRARCRRNCSATT